MDNVEDRFAAGSFAAKVLNNVKWRFGWWWM